MTEPELYLPIFSALDEYHELCGEDRTDAEAADKASEVLASLKLARERAEAYCLEHPGTVATANLQDELLPLILSTRREVLLWL